jgi:hypothetical protein
MQISFSPSTLGFYAAEVHGSAIPPDAVDITEAEHTALLAAQAAGAVIAADEAGRPVTQAAPPPPPIRVIRSLAFRERLSDARRKAITAAAVQMAAAGDAELLTWLLDQAAGGTTDLDDPRVQGAVLALHVAEVITEAERDALLVDGNPSET